MAAALQTRVVAPALDTNLLRTRGWTSLNLSLSRSTAVEDRLTALASSLGTPKPMRAGGPVCEPLMPTNASQAKRHSLSRRFSLGEFPLHVDTAHWPTPCRFLVLACVNPGSAERATLLLNPKRLPLGEKEFGLLYGTPLRVTNGRASFFSTILSKSRPFIRLDPGCMTAVTPDGVAAIHVLSRDNWYDYLELIHWEEGKVVIIDNWRVLHGRDKSFGLDSDRKLLRIAVV